MHTGGHGERGRLLGLWRPVVAHKSAQRWGLVISLIERRSVSGRWERVWRPDGSGGGYLVAFELAAWTRSGSSDSGADTSDCREAWHVTRDVMAGVVTRQEDLHERPVPVVQQGSYSALGGEVFPRLDHLEWAGDRVRVDFRHVVAFAAGPRWTTRKGTYYLEPDGGGLYHLDELGWDLECVPEDVGVLRLFYAGMDRGGRLDRVARCAVAAVEDGWLSYDDAMAQVLGQVRGVADRQLPHLSRHAGPAPGDRRPSPGPTL